MGKYFGTDGFRGEAGITLTADHAYKVGRFLGWYYNVLRERNGDINPARIVIGKDTRRSSYMFEYSLVAGLTASGADAYLLHVTTTPSVAYIARVDDFDCGIMISASHNPYYDNGIKLIDCYGEKMSEETLLLVEDYIDGKLHVFDKDWPELPFAHREHIGRTVDYVAGRNRYMGYLISLGIYSFKGVKVGLDCANGASWNIAKSVFDALGADTYALRKMNIPTVIFINKIDQAGVDLQSVVQSVRDKLSADIIIKQTVSLSPEIVLEENTDIEAWDAVIENNDELLEKYIAGEPISREKLAREEQQRVQDASLFPVYHGSAKNGLGIQPLMDAVTGLFQPIGEQGGAALCGSVFKVEYTDCGQRRVYLRLYSGTLRLRDTVALAGREKLKITEMRIPSKGEIVRTDTAYQGEIVILPSDSVRLNDVLGDQTRLPRKRWREDPLPMLRTTIAPKTAAQRERLLDALTQLADTDPLLRCEVDSITHEIILSFLGRVQLEVVSALLSEKYKLETVVKEPTVIYMERPLKAASHTIHIEVPPNPFWASIGLSVTPLPLGSGVQYESRVSLGYLNQSFQNAVRDGIRYGLEQGLFGWNVTDCKICFEYGLYYSPVSTPADFRSLAPIVLEQALKESGTQLLEPYLSFTLYAPREYLSRAYHDAPKYCATIETAQVKKDEVVFTGEIPARCIQAYRTDLAFYTNGRSVCLTELKGYQAAVGQPVIQPRRPNSRLDKVRHMFQKVM